MRNHAAQLAIIKQLSRQELHSTAGNCQADDRQESCSSAGNCQADEQTLITQLSRPGSRDWACTVHVADHTLITCPSIQYRASNLDWQLVSYMIFYMFQCHSPKSSLPSPTECIRLFYTSVSLLLSRTPGYCYHLSKFHIYALVYTVRFLFSFDKYNHQSLTFEDLMIII